MTKVDQTITDTGSLSEDEKLQEGGKSDLKRKFDELPFDKKKQYLHTAFGTIRGCTGFFDTRFTAGMSDYKNFDMGNGDMADVIIRQSGTYSDEGGGSESDNSIVIIFQGKIYGGGGVRYFESNKIDKPYLNYKEIIECSLDESNNEFTVTVNCADQSKKTISVRDGKTYLFEEELISKLRVPQVLRQQEIEINTLLQEEISHEQKELATQNMYQRAVDIFSLKNNRVDAQKYMNRPGVRLSEEQKRSYIEYLLNGWKQGWGECMRKEDITILSTLLKTFDDQEYIKDICDKILERSVGWELKNEILESIQEITQLGGFNIQDWHTKKINKYCEKRHLFQYMHDAILESGQDGKIRYKKFYDLHKPIKESELTVIATALGKNIDDLSKESFLNYIEGTEKFGFGEISYFLQIMKEKSYDKSLYAKVLDKIVTGDYERLRRYADSNEKVIDSIITIRTHANKKIKDDLLFEMFYRTKNGNEEHLWNKISKILSTEEIESTLHMMVDKHLNEDKEFCDLSLIVNRGFEDTSKITKLFDKIITKRYGCSGDKLGIDYCNRLISTLKNKKIFSKDNLCDTVHQLYKDKVDQFCQNGTLRSLIQFYPVHFDDKDFLEDICDKFIVNSGDKFNSGSTITDGFVKAGFDQNRIQNFIKRYLGNISVLCNLIEGFGLNIDKVRVNTLIESFFQEGKLEEAEKVAKAGGLYDLREKKILTWKLENKKFDSRDASRAIDKSGLDKVYYKYVIDIHINRGELQSALELAEKFDLLISDEQFNRYLGKDDRLRKADEERKLREKLEREKLAEEMMRYVLEGKISCDINYTQDQKYILIRDKQSGLKVASKNLERHKDIAAEIDASKKDVIGGGRLFIDDIQKTIKIYGCSGDFGKVAGEYNTVLEMIIKIQYPDYKIEIE